MTKLSQTSHPSHVIFIGIDGATWSVIDPLIRQNKLPNLKKLKEKGLCSTLTSTYPPSSPPAWTSMYTGVTPGKHNIFDFVKRKSDSYFVEPIFSRDRKAPALWDIVSSNNKKVIALSIPFSYPLTPVNGIITSGLGAPSRDSDFCYPANFKKYIRDNYPDFDIDFEEQSFNLPSDRELVFQKVNNVTQSQIALSKDLIVNRDWDLFTIVFRSLDVIQHFFMDEPEILARFYGQIDLFLGWLTDQLDNKTTLIIASDHGFKLVKTKFYLNNWLKNEGFLALKNQQGFKLNADQLEKVLIKLGLRKLVFALKKSPILEPLMKLIPTTSRIALSTQADWTNTRAYYMGISNNGLIFINKIGREPEGIVEPAEVYMLYKEIRNKLMKLTHNGHKVVDQVLFAEDVYTYGSNRSGPDIIVSLIGEYSIEDGLSESNVSFSEEKNKPGNHHPDGILGIYPKPQIKKESKYSIYSITPTILKLLNIPQPDYLDGKPI